MKPAFNPSVAAAVSVSPAASVSVSISVSASAVASVVVSASVVSAAEDPHPARALTAQAITASKLKTFFFIISPPVFVLDRFLCELN